MSDNFEFGGIYGGSSIDKQKLKLKGNDEIIKCPICQKEVIARLLPKHIKKVHSK